MPSKYEENAWEEVQKAKQRLLTSRAKRMVPKVIRDRFGRATGTAVDKLGEMPGADKAQQLVNDVLEGLTSTAASLTSQSIDTDRIISAYAKKGYPITSLSEISELDLKAVDDVRPRMDIGYITSGALTGASAGLAISGSELGAVAGITASAGAATAPALGVVVTALLADAIAVVAMCLRVTFHYGAYYGFDPDLTEERLRAMAILSVGTAVSQGGKTQAYAELNKLVNMLVRGAPWAELNANVIAKIIVRGLAFMGIKLTKQELAMLLPVAGVFIGAGLNAKTLHKAGATADLLYKEAFLERKGFVKDDFAAHGGGKKASWPGSASSASFVYESSAEDDEEILDIAGLVEEALLSEDLGSEPGAVHDFEMLLNPSEIEALADRYSYKDDRAALKAGSAARQRGYFELSEFLEVCAWKTNRTTSRVESNTSPAVQTITKRALATEDEADRMAALLELNGVGVPTASTILFSAFPDRYPILDVRALESLGYESSRTTYSVAFWLRYLGTCRALAEEHSVSIRRLDKALWQFSKEKRDR